MTLSVEIPSVPMIEILLAIVALLLYRLTGVVREGVDLLRDLRIPHENVSTLRGRSSAGELVRVSTASISLSPPLPYEPPLGFQGSHSERLAINMSVAQIPSRSHMRLVRAGTRDLAERRWRGAAGPQAVHTAFRLLLARLSPTITLHHRHCHYYHSRHPLLPPSAPPTLAVFLQVRWT